MSHLTLLERARALNAHRYQGWDVVWVKVSDLHDAEVLPETPPPWEPASRTLLREWRQGGARERALEVVAAYVGELLRDQLPEDSIWDELQEAEHGPRWRPLSGAPGPRFDALLGWSAYQGDAINDDEDSARLWTERSPTAEERAWVAQARGHFFALFPPDEARYFEAAALDDEPEPWDVPQAIVALGPRFVGAAFLQGHLGPADWGRGLVY